MTGPKEQIGRRVTRWFGLDVPAQREPEPEPEFVLQQPVIVVTQQRPGPLLIRRDIPQPLTVAAKGGGLFFQLYVSHIWNSDGITSADLNALTGQYVKEIQRDLLDWSRIVAADFPPHHLDEMQAAINARFADETWTFDEGDVSVACTVRIRVVPDDVVREQVADYWTKVIAMENKYELDLRRVQHVRDLAQQWTSIVAGLRDNPVTAHAAELAEQELVAVLQRLANEQTTDRID